MFDIPTMPSDIIECCLGSHQDNNNEGSDKTIKIDVKSALPAKAPCSNRRKFAAQDSPLTEAFNTENGSSLYRICMILSLLTICSCAAVDFANDDKLNIGQWIIWENIQGIPLSLLCWIAMFLLLLLLYMGFCLWARKRSKSKSFSLWDLLFVPPLILLTALIILMPAAAIIFLNLAPVCSFGLLMEQVRFLTKSYAFLRVKVPHVINGDIPPDLYHFLLYMAVPTMIYNDKYPRSKAIRWKLVGQHCLELIWTGMIVSFCLARVHASYISDFRSLWLDAVPAAMTLVVTLVPTTIILLTGFFAYFHSFCNLQAELTCFQDRMFYKDWWNATSFKTFFTSWNTLIQDWLYQYVYVDVKRLTGNRILAAGAVFLVSGLVHEYVLSFFFRFFYPVLIIVYVGAGLILKSIPTARVSDAFGNIMLWICIPIGCSIILVSYMTEFFARRNCPYKPDESIWVEFFVPRSWTCTLNDLPH